MREVIFTSFLPPSLSLSLSLSLSFSRGLMVKARNRSKRVHTPVALICSLSDK